MGVPTNALPSAEKLRGGYYTPGPVADWLAGHACAAAPRRVLEPSAGDGALLRPLLARLSEDAVIDAIECDGDEAAKLAAQLGPDPRVRVHVADAFSWFSARPAREVYDLVIGNPPYIRYRHWPKQQSERAFELMREHGLHPNRLTSAWVPFVVLATAALRPGGALALVLPAELLQVGYAGELRRYLSEQYDEITLITFEELVFPTILQETILLIARKRTGGLGSARIRTVELKNELSLTDAAGNFREDDVADLDHSTEKWTKYLLTAREVGFLRAAAQHSSLIRLGDIAEVDVGIVTGRNDVFVISPSAARAAGIARYCKRMVGRSAHVPGVVLRSENWQLLEDQDARVLLVDLPAVPRDSLSGEAQLYVAAAEAAGHHTGYKCRVRMPTWWAVPSTWVPDAFLLRQIYDGPRIVLNQAAATCTDTLHKVRFYDKGIAESATLNAHNSLTWALAEVRGRSYGGGVLELEPSEAEALLLPRPTRHSALPLDDLDDIIRRKGNAAGVEEVNARVLVAACGWTRSDVALARSIAEKLARRRRGRNSPRRGDIPQLTITHLHR